MFLSWFLYLVNCSSSDYKVQLPKSLSTNELDVVIVIFSLLFYYFFYFVNMLINFNPVLTFCCTFLIINIVLLKNVVSFYQGYLDFKFNVN